MEKLRDNVGIDRFAILAALIDLVATSGRLLKYVSMVASRGIPIVPGTRDPRACSNRFYVSAVPFICVIPKDVAKCGAHISIAEYARHMPSNLVDHTVKNYHGGAMTAALFQALDNGYDKIVVIAAMISQTYSDWHKR